ncbi:MAG: hypothetical protein BMS9Abin10_0201 [Gammaproteobacteria bacterium]|nr:MAG: hypothetical protein BMS9Abin10_0201 [Gammaproteobacteria bacterium]
MYRCEDPVTGKQQPLSLLVRWLRGLDLLQGHP